MRGGMLLGAPVIVSESSPRDSDGGQLVLLDGSSIILIDESVEIALSRQTTIEQDSAPTGASDTPTGASATRVNLWQIESCAILCTRRINWARARDGAAVTVTAVNYPAAA